MNELLNSHYEELYHHGVKGMKWGVRRYQNKNGDLTPAGRKRYSDEKYQDENRTTKNERAKKIAITAGVIAGASVAAYGAYKLTKFVKNKNALDVGSKIVSNMSGMKLSEVTKTHKSFASMNGREKSELIGQLVSNATARGFKPTGDGDLDMFNVFTNYSGLGEINLSDYAKMLRR